MLQIFVFGLIVGLVRSQALDNDTLNELNFLSTTKCPIPELCSHGFQPLPDSTTSNSKGYTQKCGEGDEQGKYLCVNYQYCDGTTNTIVQNGLTAGFGIINIRAGVGRCPHFLENCCKVPKGGLSPNFNPTARPPTTTSTASPPTARTVRTTSSRPILSSNYCGTRNTNGTDFRITGNVNNEAEYGEFPWMVAVLKKYSTPSPGEPFSICGGSLINPSVVLTGAHCVYRYDSNDLKVRVGEWDSQTTRERLPYQERQVVEIISHINFVSAGLFDDFALLILDSPVDRANHIGTVCLPEQDQVITSRNCLVSGWGKDVFGSGGIYQDILKKIELPIVPNAACQNALRKTVLGTSYILHDSFVCAGGDQGKDACTGDGGSPLVCPDPRNPDRYVLTGMVAWGIGCGTSNVPGVYAGVAKARSWIDDNLRRRNLDTNSYIL